jgi:putative tryptophan/tyrosine transport system substrate-binding protein
MTKLFMQRREFITFLGIAVAQPHQGFAQSSKIYRIGLLGALAPPPDYSPFVAPLIRGLEKVGYAQGRSFVFERRGAEGKLDRLQRLAQELAESKVDVVVAIGFPPALAMRQMSGVPAVAFGAGDPVATGLVQSMARPGGNMTGVSDIPTELTAKRLELLKDLAPQLRRVAMLWNASDLGMTLRYQASEAAARTMGITVQALGVREPDDFEEAFSLMTRERPDAILMVADSLTTLNRKRVFDFAVTNRLPAIYEFDFLVREGGLMSYSVDLDEAMSRVAALIGRILKGAKPADLPLEQPTRFKFALNLKTARALGLTVPPTLVARADEVIE